MNNLDDLLDQLENVAFDRGVNSISLERSPTSTQQAAAYKLAKDLNEHIISELKGAIRELFQAQIPANVGELITALRMDAYKHGVANGLYSCERGTIDKCLEKETAANAAEAALRKALGVQR